MRRRDVLAAIGAGSIGGIAGCSETAPMAGEGSESGEAAGGDDETGGSGADGGADTDTGTDADTDDLPTDWPSGPYADYDATTVTVRNPEGDDLGAVRAAIADTRDKRYLGLSDATSLPENAGMLFTYSGERDPLRYVMREMDFGIDIVYVDADRTITRIHNAPEPGPNEDGSEQKYPGSGQYVLEVPYEWTDRRGVEIGDSLEFDL